MKLYRIVYFCARVDKITEAYYTPAINIVYSWEQNKNLK
jgi:hypothetical protein